MQCVPWKFLIVTGVFWSLAACSGSSGGGGAAPQPPAEPTYAVSGTATGLKGETLEITLNGGQPMQVTANGTFQFPERLRSGVAYTVAVTSGTDTYRIIGNAGTIGSADVTDVAVHAINWSHPQSVNEFISPEGTDAYSVRTAIDGQGNMIAVWAQYDDFDYEQTFMSEFRNGTWTHPTSLSDNVSPDLEDGDSPDVAMAENGNAIIVWRQYDGSNYQVFMSECRGGTWTHPQDLNDSISVSGQHAYNPRVAMNATGDAVIVWRQFDGSRYQTYKSELRSGTWVHPTNLADKISPSGQNVEEPQVAIAANGDTVIIWRQVSGQRQVFKSEYRNSAWTHPTGLTDNISPDGQHCYQAHVAMGDAGQTVIIWYQHDGTRNQVFMSEFRNATWTHPTGLTDNISVNGQHAYDPAVDMASNGDAIIVWRQYDGSDYQIFKSELRGGTWTHPTNLADNISADDISSYYPQVAVSATGGVIVWQRDYGYNENVFMTRSTANGWTDPAHIAPPNADAYEPEVSMNERGDIFIAWPAYQGFTDGIFTSEFR